MVSEYSYSVDISPDKFHPDLKIIVNDSKHRIVAHRAVLASHSSFLKRIFLTSDFDDEPTLFLPDFSIEDVTLMLKLLYGKIPEIKYPNGLFTVLALSPTNLDTDLFLDTEESELTFETIKSELVLDPMKRSRSKRNIEESELYETVESKIIIDPIKRPRSKSKVFIDTRANLVPDSENDGGADNIDVEAYILKEPSDVRPWVCKICLEVGGPNVKNPYRTMQKHNLQYHIIRKHFKMEIPKNWKVGSTIIWTLVILMLIILVRHVCQEVY